MADALETAVAAHYRREGLLQAILDGLSAAGADLDALSPQDLAAVDEFHTGGRRATLLALDRLPLGPDVHVLDAGCGVGGVSRCLAAEHGCRVTGVDLTPEFIEVARALTDRLGLADRCAFTVGSVLATPLETASVDVAVTFHVAMNIEDRAGFYAELARVVRPGGALCVFDVMRGPGGALPYPTPWAETAAMSFLKTRDETIALLDASGFEVTDKETLTKFALAFFRDTRASAAEGPPPLGLHLLTGPNTGEKFSNYVAGLEAGAVEPVLLIGNRR